MNGSEWRAVLALGMVYALRMVGMFMVLPVLTLYAQELPGGATPEQIGLAIGLYGLANAVLQIPLGILSDRIGRKPVIYGGMVVFAIGSFVAGFAQDIQAIEVGRLIQGMGAVSSATQALLADVTRDQVRSMAMAIVGAGVGLAFAAAVVVGPVLSGLVGLNGLFLVTGALALFALPIVGFAVPTPEVSSPKLGGLMQTLADWKLMRLDLGILLLQAMMSGLFGALPVAIAETLDLGRDEHWKIYLPVLALSIVPGFGLIAWAETKRKVPSVFRFAIILLAVSLAIVTEWHASPVGLVIAVLLFFIAFNYMEGTLPSLVSRAVSPSRKGAALGLYTTAQFLGVWGGAALVGFARQHEGLTGAFAACALLPVVWLIVNSIGEPITVGDSTGAPLSGEGPGPAK